MFENNKSQTSKGKGFYCDISWNVEFPWKWLHLCGSHKGGEIDVESF